MPPKAGAKRKAAAAGPAAAGGSKKARSEGPNAELAECFRQLAQYELMADPGRGGWAANAYKKVAATLKGLSAPVKSGAAAAALPNVGKASAAKIQEWLDTGKISRLEEFRSDLGPLDKPVKGTPLTPAQMKAVAQATKEAMELGAAELKAELRRNGQKCTGSKAELAARVGDGRTLGAIPKGPAGKGCCGVGYLSFDPKTGLYTCPGGFDDDHYVPCAFKSGGVVRKEWLTEEREQ
eukprot:TRINITY_DN18056_c0_g2_i2.p2 TRINITY_DN18056_c0_g2~~TRINITY_DN18056_c0_g2_i2.p2  ORF type:complete len:278 (+),score=77.52 TRINITY_DN18056_c0_g2_i2:124-834(+)